jgi:hypothetical protein
VLPTETLKGGMCFRCSCTAKMEVRGAKIVDDADEAVAATEPATKEYFSNCGNFVHMA